MSAFPNSPWYSNILLTLCLILDHSQKVNAEKQMSNWQLRSQKLEIEIQMRSIEERGRQLEIDMREGQSSICYCCFCCCCCTNVCVCFCGGLYNIHGCVCIYSCFHKLKINYFLQLEIDMREYLDSHLSSPLLPNPTTTHSRFFVDVKMWFKLSPITPPILRHAPFLNLPA